MGADELNIIYNILMYKYICKTRIVIDRLVLIYTTIAVSLHPSIYKEA